MPAGGDSSPFIIDVEASGLGPRSYPIEIGVALQPGQRYSVLVRPTDEWRWWDAQAESIHRIARDVLLEHGRSVSTVAAELNALLAGKTVFSDCWVVDKPWLSQLFHEARTHMAFDVSPIERLLPPEQMVIWDTVKREVIDDLGVTRHRASHDAMMIQETFRRSSKRLSKPGTSDGKRTRAR